MVAPAEPKQPNVAADMSQDEAEALLLPKYKEAMSYGVDALRAWQQSENTQDADVEVGASANAPPPGLGPEDNNALLGHPHLMTVKTEYSKRPLPFVIGTRQFAEDEYAGLRFDEYDDHFLEDERASIPDHADDSIRDGVSSDDEDAEFYSSDEEGAPSIQIGVDGIPLPPPPPPTKNKKDKEKAVDSDGDSIKGPDDDDDDDDDVSETAEDAGSSAANGTGKHTSEAADGETDTVDSDADESAVEEEDETPKQPPKGP